MLLSIQAVKCEGDSFSIEDHYKLHYGLAKIRVSTYTMLKYVSEIFSSFLEPYVIKNDGSLEDSLIKSSYTIAQNIDYFEDGNVSYHNRKHFMEVMLSAKMLAEIEFVNCPPFYRRKHILISLVAALAHDYDHDGSINRLQGDGISIEMKTISKISAIFEYNNVDDDVIKIIESMILDTDLGDVERRNYNRKKYDSENREIVDCLTMVLSDADVLPSIYIGTGLIRGLLLRDEWDFTSDKYNDCQLKKISQSTSDIDKRVDFLKYVKLRSDASKKLGFDFEQEAQIKILSEYINMGGDLDVRDKEIIFKINKYVRDELSKIRRSYLLKSKPSKKCLDASKNFRYEVFRKMGYVMLVQELYINMECHCCG